MFEMQIGSGLMDGITFIFLCVCAVYDMRKKEIPLIMVIIGMAAAFGIDLWRMFNQTLSITEVGLALLPGLFLLSVSFCTREKVGYGDGLLLMTSGLLAGFYKCCLSLFISLVCCSGCALLLLALHKVKKNSSIPFVPFLAIGLGVGFFV